MWATRTANVRHTSTKTPPKHNTRIMVIVRSPGNKYHATFPAHQRVLSALPACRSITMATTAETNTAPMLALASVKRTECDMCTDISGLSAQVSQRPHSSVGALDGEVHTAAPHEEAKDGPDSKRARTRPTPERDCAHVVSERVSDGRNTSVCRRDTLLHSMCIFRSLPLPSLPRSQSSVNLACVFTGARACH